MVQRLFSLAVFVAVLVVTAAAQSSPNGNLPPPPTPQPQRSQEPQLPPEMRVRLAIERDEEEHRKFVEDVKQLDTLSLQVQQSFRERSDLSSDDLKKVAKIEKLANRILSHAGGSKVKDEENEPANILLSDALKEISDATNAIKENLMAQTRLVVSYVVIGSSNKIIGLAKFILRSKKSKD